MGQWLKHDNHPLKCNRQNLRIYFLFSGIYLFFHFFLCEKLGYIFDVDSLAKTKNICIYPCAGSSLLLYRSSNKFFRINMVRSVKKKMLEQAYL